MLCGGRATLIINVSPSVNQCASFDFVFVLSLFLSHVVTSACFVRRKGFWVKNEGLQSARCKWLVEEKLKMIFALHCQNFLENRFAIELVLSDPLAWPREGTAPI